MQIKPKIVNVKEIISTRLFTAQSVELLFSNGAHRVYERLLTRPKPAVMIVPVMNNDTLLLIKEYCVGTDCYELCFPKGLVEKDETLKQGANRELMEEIGYGARQLSYLKTLSTAPGFINAKMNLFIAQDLYVKQLQGDEPEALEVVRWPLNDIKGLMDKPEFTEARSVAALFLAQQFLQNRKHR